MNGYFFRANGPNDTIGSQVRIQTGLLRSQHDRGMGMYADFTDSILTGQRSRLNTWSNRERKERK